MSESRGPFGGGEVGMEAAQKAAPPGLSGISSSPNPSSCYCPTLEFLRPSQRIALPCQQDPDAGTESAPSKSDFILHRPRCERRPKMRITMTLLMAGLLGSIGCSNQGTQSSPSASATNADLKQMVPS